MKLTPMLTMLLVATLVLAGCVLPPSAAPPIEPNAGSWQTWVVTDATALRPPAPPDQAATQAELQEMHQLMAGRNADQL